MTEPRGYIPVGRHGEPWRIPGSVPSLPATAAEDRENSCGDAQCTGGHAHAPAFEQAVQAAPFDPAQRQEILLRSYGRH